jgi:hypothetical protein
VLGKPECNIYGGVRWVIPYVDHEVYTPARSRPPASPTRTGRQVDKVESGRRHCGKYRSRRSSRSNGVLLSVDIGTSTWTSTSTWTEFNLLASPTCQVSNMPTPETAMRQACAILRSSVVQGIHGYEPLTGSLQMLQWGIADGKLHIRQVLSFLRSSLPHQEQVRTRSVIQLVSPQCRSKHTDLPMSCCLI